MNLRKVTARRLRELRKGCGLTQEKLAVNIGISKTTIGAWENDRQELSGRAIVILANYYNVSADYLLGLKDSANREK